MDSGSRLGLWFWFGSGSGSHAVEREGERGHVLDLIARLDDLAILVLLVRG